MAAAFLMARPRQLRSGCIIGIGPPPTLAPGLAWIEGAHPIPNSASLDAGRCALRIARETREDEVLAVLLSGGASAMMALPVEDVDLADKQATTSRLLAAGADIHELNAVRKHLSGVKGGRLAAAARGRVIALVISDVVGDELSVVGSGPTVGDPTTYADALAVLERFGGCSAYPPVAVRHLEHGVSGLHPETPKPGAACFARTTTTLIGSARQAMEGARVEAEARGFHVRLRESPVVGEAREAAHRHLAFVTDEAATLSRPACVISSGETTVRVEGTGRGGRNQEFALALVEPLRNARLSATVISVGTDGVDGPTDAAGAIVDHSTWDRARRAGAPDPRVCLMNHDSYRFFHSLGDLVVIGPTGTNVGDLQVVLIA